MSSGEKDRLIRPGTPGRMSRSYSPALERGALVAALAGAALRWGVSGGTAGTGLNLFIHLLPVVALALWFAARALAGGAAWRFSGLEVAVPLLAIVHLVSVLVASHRLPALEMAVAHLAFGLFAILALQAMGRELLRALLLSALFALAVHAFVQYAVIFPAALAANQNPDPEFQRRLASREPFAAFVGPNQLAAFLVLTLPLAFGAALDRHRLAAVPLAAGAVALWMTGSLGGGVSLACAGAAFAGLALTRRRGRRVLVGAGATAVAAVVALLLFSPLLESMAAKSYSMHTRRAYWRAAGRVIAERPAAGAGLANFEEHYARVKGDVQQETRHAHNDYLQILAETGVLGLLAVAALLGLGLRRACAPEAEPPAEGEPPRRWILPAAAAAAGALLLLRYGLDLGLLASGLAFALFAWGSRNAPAAGPWTRIGASAGYLGLLVHMSVEFLWIEPGAALALYAGLALLLAFAKPIEVRLPPPACAAAAGLLALVGAPLFVLAGPALAADRELEDARATLWTAAGVSAELAEAAQKHNPLLADAYAIYATARILRGGTDPVAIESALQALDNAIALRPDHVAHRVEAARLNLELHYVFKRGTGAVDRHRTEAHLVRAREHQEKAVALYPARCHGRYALGRILDLLGERERAAAEFAEALRLSDLASKEMENLARLQLFPVQRVRAMARTGRTSEAAREAKRLLPLGGEGDVKLLLGEVKRRPELLRLPEGEIDEVTRPLIEAAIDDLLR